MFDFTEEEINRYSRHILLQDVGVEGQEKWFLCLSDLQVSLAA